MRAALDISKDIHSLTDFKRKTTELVAQLKTTGRPLVLTVNGKAELVVQDAASYGTCRSCRGDPEGFGSDVSRQRPTGSSVLQANAPQVWHTALGSRLKR